MVKAIVAAAHRRDRLPTARAGRAGIDEMSLTITSGARRAPRIAAVKGFQRPPGCLHTTIGRPLGVLL